MRFIHLLERLAGRTEAEQSAPSQDMFVKTDGLCALSSANDNRRAR